MIQKIKYKLLFLLLFLISFPKGIFASTNSSRDFISSGGISRPVQEVSIGSVLVNMLKFLSIPFALGLFITFTFVIYFKAKGKKINKTKFIAIPVVIFLIIAVVAFLMRNEWSSSSYDYIF